MCVWRPWSCTCWVQPQSRARRGFANQTTDPKLQNSIGAEPLWRGRQEVSRSTGAGVLVGALGAVLCSADDRSASLGGSRGDHLALRKPGKCLRRPCDAGQEIEFPSDSKSWPYALRSNAPVPHSGSVSMRQSATRSFRSTSCSSSPLLHVKSCTSILVSKCARATKIPSMRRVRKVHVALFATADCCPGTWHAPHCGR